METTRKRVLLPTNVQPINYDLHFKPDLKAFNFTGTGVVSVKVSETTNTILVNALELNITKAEYTATGGNAQAAKSINFNEKEETVSFEFAEALQVGEGSLNLEFNAPLTDSLKGFYRSKYVKENKEESWMAVTQFEATDARRAFPCWDEPLVKATFDVTLTVQSHFTTISNMPIKSEKADGDNKVVVFDRSPIMSTYLLAMVVGELEYVEGKTTTGVDVRVYAPLGKKEQGRFALDVALRTLPFYNDYFGIPYPLPKSDLVAIPDFAAGAMENWGCITYRETALLVDPVTSSASNKQWVALVVGHELAHQWFGNIVTMEWWTHLWLNEGFATWIEYLCVDYCFPEWDIWTQFVTNDLGRAFALDGLKSTHPVEVEIYDASEIDEIFDAISYSKGSSIIRMLAAYLGEASFKKGLNFYLNKHQYGNAVTEDLWQALAGASDKDVRALMETWTKQDGYPVVTVDVGDSEGTFKLTQSRFLASGPESSDKSTWWVPVGAVSQDNADPTFKLFTEASGTLEVKGFKKDSWIKLNPDQTGVYRVKYSDELLNRLIKGEALKSSVLKATDRIGIQADAWALAKAGQMPTSQVLALLDAYKEETAFTVWADLTASLGTLDAVLSESDFYPEWRKFCVSLYEKIGAQVGWDAKEGESHLTRQLRGLALTKLGLCGHAPTVAEAQRRFALVLDGDEKAVVPDLLHGVYRICLANGDESTFEALLKIYRNATMHEAKERVMEALGSARDPALLQKALDFGMSDEVRSQDAVFVLVRVAANPKGRQLAWDNLKKNVDTLYKKYTGGFLVGRLAKGCTQYFLSEEKAKEVEAFFAEHPAPAIDRAVKQSVEEIRANTAWLARDGPAVADWLKTRQSN
eukprot:TRINITY_DN2978_c0_g1_i2.p1 TRINITY_DN2978_c0_g1~~TRINITY_DN2978_c0_g1_i2.p1  ORF type:complete len:911 (-),score=164.43 TRINITY_DN2978_c0_g1_i2:27-2624(-)